MGMRGENFSYASNKLGPLITHVFNRPIIEVFPHSRTTHTIASIHKVGDPMEPDNYKTAMVVLQDLWLSDGEGTKQFSTEGGSLSLGTGWLLAKFLHSG